MQSYNEAYATKVGLAKAWVGPISSLINPTSETLTKYSEGQIVYNPISNLVYMKTSNTNWSLLGPGDSDLETLGASSGDSPVSPSAGQIDLNGTANQIVVTGNGAGHSLAWSFPAAVIFPGSAATTTTLTVGTDLIVTGDASVGGNLTVTGNLVFNNLTAVNGTFTGTLTSAGATTLATTGSSVNTFGNLTGTTALTLSVGTGNFLLQGAATSTMTLGTGLTSGTITLGSAAMIGNIAIGTGTGTQTVNVNIGAGVKTTVIGSTNTTSATTVQSGSGALNVTATGGALTVNSGIGALGVSTDAAATTVSLATGAGVKTLMVGSTNSSSSSVVDCGTAGASFGASANAHTTTLGSTNTTSTTVVQSGSGGITMTGVTTHNANVILNGAATQLQIQSGAATDFAGTATLIAGTSGAILNTNIAATDEIHVTREGINASTALGLFNTTITPATSFTITALNPADGSTQTGDASTVKYFIVRAI